MTKLKTQKFIINLTYIIGLLLSGILCFAGYSKNNMTVVVAALICVCSLTCFRAPAMEEVKLNISLLAVNKLKKETKNDSDQ